MFKIIVVYDLESDKTYRKNGYVFITLNHCSWRKYLGKDGVKRTSNY